MRRSLTIRYLALGGLAAALLSLSLWATARPQDQEPGPSSSGPDRGVGDTVLVPKKTAPPPTTSPAPGTTTQPGSKPPEKIDPNEVFTLTTSTNLVNVDVLVTDNNGNPIPGLSKVNFKLVDEGVPQSITNFATGDAPMTICMLIEFSNKHWIFLYKALQYSYDFVRVIEPKDWVAVVTFDLNPTILADFTQNRYEVTQALDRLRIPGFSEINLYDALSFTIDRMKDIQGRKAILVICTGIDTFSKLTYEQLLKIVRNSDTVIYPVSILEFVSVRYGEGIGALQARNTLNYVAKYSGGQAYFPRFEGELPGIYQQIAQQLRSQYSLGFIPSNSSRDGKFRKLKIELVDAQGNPLKITDQKGKNVKYKIVAREGYYAPKS
jgi:Ca-activated chloride channel family protein